MKPSLIFHQYVWLVNILRQYGPLTLGEINEKWKNDRVTDGNPLSRSTFNRHRDSIIEMFGVVIDCEYTGKYRYYIANSDVLEGDTVQRWMLSTLTVGGVLSNSLSIQDHIILEEVPGGEEHLQTLIQAIKIQVKVDVNYCRFGASAYIATIEPYALKLFHQRWYLIGFNGKYISTYSLDRMLSVSLTHETFEPNDNFSPQEYYSEYYGVLADETPMEHLVIRAYGMTPDYLRTLPLHHSQQEIAKTEEYTDFSLDVRPTMDFLGALLAHGAGLEILSPEYLRTQQKEEIEKMLKRYEKTEPVPTFGTGDV